MKALKITDCFQTELPPVSVFNSIPTYFDTIVMACNHLSLIDDKKVLAYVCLVLMIVISI